MEQKRILNVFSFGCNRKIGKCPSFGRTQVGSHHLHKSKIDRISNGCVSPATEDEWNECLTYVNQDLLEEEFSEGTNGNRL